MGEEKNEKSITSQEEKNMSVLVGNMEDRSSALQRVRDNNQLY